MDKEKFEIDREGVIKSDCIKRVFKILSTRTQINFCLPDLEIEILFKYYIFLLSREIMQMIIMLWGGDETT